MTTVLFVHGTGVRRQDFNLTFKKVERAIRALDQSLMVTPCYWGGRFGAHLNPRRNSIPQRSSSSQSAEEGYWLNLWQLLYEDPLYELRQLELTASELAELGTPNPDALADAVRELLLTMEPSARLQEALRHGLIFHLFEQAIDEITQAEAFTEALQKLPDNPTDFYFLLARAIVAEAIALFLEPMPEGWEDHYDWSDAPEASKDQVQASASVWSPECELQRNASLRDRIVELLAEDLTQKLSDTLGAPERVVLKPILRLATGYLRRHRLNWTSSYYPFPADILLYQTRGDTIRTYIMDVLAKASPPVVILAHSLGGIACVDLVISHPEVQVDLLVTVGSQAPFLYELGILTSLSSRDPLPPHFPQHPQQWLNIYDENDLLSFVGGKVFQGRVTDFAVDNRQPFPQSHSAYWDNKKMWEEIGRWMRRIPPRQRPDARLHS
jgi:hypothetical protein